MTYSLSIFLMSTFVEALSCGGPWARAQCAYLVVLNSALLSNGLLVTYPVPTAGDMMYHQSHHCNTMPQCTGHRAIYGYHLKVQQYLKV